eukprot:2208831-Rhodomonas_salina.1
MAPSSRAIRTGFKPEHLCVRQEKAQDLRTLKEELARAQAASARAQATAESLAAKELALRQKFEEAQRSMECAVCLEATAGTVLMPCGHCFCNRQ